MYLLNKCVFVRLFTHLNFYKMPTFLMCIVCIIYIPAHIRDEVIVSIHYSTDLTPNTLANWSMMFSVFYHFSFDGIYDTIHSKYLTRTNI